MTSALHWFVEVTETRRGPRDAPACGRVDVIKRHWFPDADSAEAFHRAEDARRRRGFPIKLSSIIQPGHSVFPAP